MKNKIMNTEKTSIEAQIPAFLVGAVMPSCLRLSLKTKWFEMTKSGIKTEDYRNVTPYWVKRLMADSYKKICLNDKELVDYLLFHIDVNYLIRHHAKKFDYNIMTLGYPKSTDTERI